MLRAVAEHAAPFSIASVVAVPLNQLDVQINVTVWKGISFHDQVRCAVLKELDKVRLVNQQFVVFVKEAE